ncbi:uncharacterized protein LOC105686297 [Athalia rosae]|uniref:uncharacterized protein LOC105686297 n=1 Tax=Athalia rosae TaxID=37344 RepID=UPI0020340791|nr:uncharacterized protein LOC105686297 [Athalia rosae]
MHFFSSFVLLAICGCLAIAAEKLVDRQVDLQGLPAPALGELSQEDNSAGLVREKRTLFLKKKILGAGLLGFGLGIAKGYKAGYHTAPEVHHVYLSPPPPPVKYVEYVEKPVYVERIVEKPVHVEYEPAWSQPAPAYGPW